MIIPNRKGIVKHNWQKIQLFPEGFRGAAGKNYWEADT